MRIAGTAVPTEPGVSQTIRGSHHGLQAGRAPTLASRGCIICILDMVIEAGGFRSPAHGKAARSGPVKRGGIE
jgi:hypothetical protein